MLLSEISRLTYIQSKSVWRIWHDTVSIKRIQVESKLMTKIIPLHGINDPSRLINIRDKEICCAAYAECSIVKSNSISDESPAVLSYLLAYNDFCEVQTGLR